MKQAVIKKIAESNLLSDIIKNVAKDSNDVDLADLEQDLYVELLEKDEDLIDYLYENNQLNYFLTRMVTNNIHSKTSRYYYRYKKNKLKQTTLDDYKETAENQD